MATYWVFCLDGPRVIHHLDFEADDDAEAVELAIIRGEDCDCEIWCGDRKVAAMAKDGGRPVLENAAGSPRLASSCLGGARS